jgi:Arc/MetJ family transcription regulator
MNVSNTAPTHRTTIEIEVPAFEGAQRALGTAGYKETVNEALRVVSRDEQLHRGADLIRAGGLDLITPAELEEQRHPRA